METEPIGANSCLLSITFSAQLGAVMPIDMSASTFISSKMPLRNGRGRCVWQSLICIAPGGGLVLVEEGWSYRLGLVGSRDWVLSRKKGELRQGRWHWLHLALVNTSCLGLKCKDLRWITLFASQVVGGVWGQWIFGCCFNPRSPSLVFFRVHLCPNTLATRV